MKMVNQRARASCQTFASADPNDSEESLLLSNGGDVGSAFQSATAVVLRAATETVAETKTSFQRAKGDRKAADRLAVTAMPKIIISQTTVAAAARLSPETRAASKASNDVPDRPTPIPTSRNAKTAI